MLREPHLARGDRRLALNRLRLDASAKSHHLSTFRSGIYLGLALSALTIGIYQCMCRTLTKPAPAPTPILYRLPSEYEEHLEGVEGPSLHIRNTGDAHPTFAAYWCQYQCMGSRTDKLSVYLR